MRPRAVVLVTSLAIAPLSWPAAASPQLRSTPTVPDRPAPTPGRVPDAAWDTFSADVTIRRQVVKADGRVAREAPPIRYRWVRTRGERGWTTTLSVVSVAPDTVHGLSGPRTVPASAPVARVEAGDARTPMRAFDASGRQLFQLPTPPTSEAGGADLGNMGTSAHPVPLAPSDLDERVVADAMSSDWIEQFLPAAANIASRRERLTRELGTRTGGARGLERFVTQRGGDTTELLMDPAWAVPVEVNVVRGGALVSHSVVSYQQVPGGGLVRRRMRSEQLMSPESGDRAVAQIDFENVRLDRGGVR